MTGKVFLSGVVVGVVGGAVATLTIAYHQWSKLPKDETITFTDYTFSDSMSVSSEDSFVNFSGTIADERGFARNNTMSAHCSNQTMQCEIATLEQIGEDHVGPIRFEDWQITDWKSGLIVGLKEDLCATTTMNIDRENEAVNFVTMPMNLTNSYCSGSDTQVRRWSIGRSLFWLRNDPEGHWTREGGSMNTR